MVTLERLRALFAYDAETGAFTRLSHSPKAPLKLRSGTAGTRRRDGYVLIQIDGRRYLAHRLAWLYAHGEWPNVIDHINGDPSDNRLANLRSGTQGENCQNLRRAKASNKTGLLGVSPAATPGKFVSFIQVGGVNRNLGTFNTAEQAHSAYLAAKADLHSHSTLEEA